MSIQYRLRSFLPPQHAQAHPPAKQRASVVSTLPTLARSPFGTRAFSSARSSSPSPLLPSFLSSSIRIRLKLHHLLPFFLLPLPFAYYFAPFLHFHLSPLFLLPLSRVASAASQFPIASFTLPRLRDKVNSIPTQFAARIRSRSQSVRLPALHITKRKKIKTTTTRRNGTEICRNKTKP